MKTWWKTMTEQERQLLVYSSHEAPAYRNPTVADISAFFSAQTPEDQRRILESFGAQTWQDLTDTKLREAEAQRDEWKRERNRAQVETRLERERAEKAERERNEWRDHAQKAWNERDDARTAEQSIRRLKNDEIFQLAGCLKTCERDRDEWKAKAESLELASGNSSEVRARVRKLTLALGAERVAELLGETPTGIRSDEQEFDKVFNRIYALSHLPTPAAGPLKPWPENSPKSGHVCLVKLRQDGWRVATYLDCVAGRKEERWNTLDGKPLFSVVGYAELEEQNPTNRSTDP